MRSVAERVWPLVDRDGPVPTHVPEIGACWIWTGNLLESGYGRITLRGVTYRAHRLVWALTQGDPGDLLVLHRCDNRRCVNPRHLFLGTDADNIADKTTKGRHRSPKGEAHGSARLSRHDVDEIRRLGGAVTQTMIAARFGVSRRTVGMILSNQIWKDG